VIFKGTRDSLRTLLLFLATMQATGGIGLITIVTALRYESEFPTSLGEAHILIPLILHALSMACEIAFVLRLDSWKQNPSGLVESRRVDGVLLISLLAFISLIWFLVRTLW
jgi:hypothetical protein